MCIWSLSSSSGESLVTPPPIAVGRLCQTGELVATAFAEAFRCLLARDQLFGESASQPLKSFPEFAVVVITLPQQRWQDYRKRCLEAWAESPIRPVPGRLIHWPTPTTSP